MPNILQGQASLVPRCAGRQDIKFSEDKYKMTEKQVSIISKLDFRPLMPCYNVDQIIDYDVFFTLDDGKEIKLAPIQIMLQLTANPPRPSSPMKI